jgi:hypothetical protein
MLPLHAMILIYAEQSKFIGHAFGALDPRRRGNGAQGDGTISNHDE